MEYVSWAPDVVEGSYLPTQDVVHLKELHILHRHWIPEYFNLGHYLWEGNQSQ
jgi:hypothetical protein